MRVARIRPRRCAYTLIELLLVLSIIAAVAGISWPILMRPMAQSVVQGAAQEFAEHLAEARIRAIEESRVYEFRWKPGTGEFEIKAQPEHRHQAPPSQSSNQFAGGRSLLLRPDDLNSSGQTTQDAANVDQQGRQPTHVHERLSSAVRFESDELVAQLRMLAGFDETGQAIPGGAANRTSSLTGSNGVELDLGDEDYEFSRETALRKLDQLNQERNENESQRNNKDQQEVQVGWSQPVRFYPDGTCTSARWALLSEDLNRVEVELRGMTGSVRLGKVSPLKLEVELDPMLNEQTMPSNGMRNGMPSASSRRSPTTTNARSRSNPLSPSMSGTSNRNLAPAARPLSSNSRYAPTPAR